MLLMLISCGKDAKEPSEQSAVSSEQTVSTTEAIKAESGETVTEADVSEDASLQSGVSEDKYYEKAPDNVTDEYESNQAFEIH